MRVTGGALAGRRLRSVPRGVRPTSDRVRESLFAWLDACVGRAVLDLYAGTGALGIEALSRGAESVLFVDRSPSAVQTLRKNLEGLDPVGAWEVRRGVALRVLRDLARSRTTFGLILLDPPYESEELAAALPLLPDAAVLAPDGVVVVERSRRAALPVPEGLEIYRSERYGDTVIDALRRLPVE